MISYPWILGAVIFGAISPFAARRFAKFMPCPPGVALRRLFHRPRFARPDNPSRHGTRRRLWQRLWGNSAFSALVAGAAVTLLFVKFPPVMASWLSVFSLGLLLAAQVDARTWFLPDLLTVPLLILGFAAAVWGGTLLPSRAHWGPFSGMFCRRWWGP